MEYNKGKDNPFYGKKHSKEIIEKIRKARFGSKRTEETKRKMSLSQTGEKGSAWKGGKTNDRRYVQIYKPKHPRRKGIYIHEHILVMEQYLGRYLKSEEVIHHLDHDPSNNHIDNLYLFPNNSEHQKYHSFLRKYVREELGLKQKIILIKAC